MVKNNLIRGALIVVMSTVLIGVLINFIGTMAGSLTPSASPADTMYTLDDIYHRLDYDAGAATGYNLDSPGVPAPTMHSLEDIYNITPAFRTDGGTAVAGDVCGAATFYATTSSKITGTRTDCSASGGYAYGDNDAAKVLTIADGAGTYDATNLFESVVKLDITFGVSSTGSLTPDGGTAGVADLFNGEIAHLTADWNLDTGTLDLACNTATFDGSGNLVANAYDGGGSGNDRWCMTDSGDAVAGDIASGKIAWVDGEAVNGSAAGVDYSLQKNRIWDDWQGDENSTDQGLLYAHNNNLDQNEEEADWTLYTDGSLDGANVASGQVYKDGTTGLYWSDCYDNTSDGGSCDTPENSFVLDGTIGDADDGLDAEDGQAVDFCEGLSLDADGGGDETDWYLPSQKELLQAYIDGAANNMPNPDNEYWSSTEGSSNSGITWIVSLHDGDVSATLKAGYYYARCVRR